MNVKDITWRTNQSDPGDEYDYRETDTPNVDSTCPKCGGQAAVVDTFLSELDCECRDLICQNTACHISGARQVRVGHEWITAYSYGT